MQQTVKETGVGVVRILAKKRGQLFLPLRRPQSSQVRQCGHPLGDSFGRPEN